MDKILNSDTDDYRDNYKNTQALNHLSMVLMSALGDLSVLLTFDLSPCFPSHIINYIISLGYVHVVYSHLRCLYLTYYFINPRCMHKGYGSRCVCICVSVTCYIPCFKDLSGVL